MRTSPAVFYECMRMQLCLVFSLTGFAVCGGGLEELETGDNLAAFGVLPPSSAAAALAANLEFACCSMKALRLWRHMASCSIN